MPFEAIEAKPDVLCCIIARWRPAAHPGLVPVLCLPDSSRQNPPFQKQQADLRPPHQA